MSGRSPSRAGMSARAAAGWWLLLAWLLAAGLARAEIPVPPLTARVTDLTGTLSTAQKEALEQRLREFEARKGSQIAVLIVPTARPETIEQYGIRVAEAWKLGRKGVDDGVLLLVAKDDRELRIEVGYGLEGVIPDAVANRVIEEIIVPYFKQGDFYGGIEAGVDRLIRLVEGEPLPLPRARDDGPEGIAGYLPFLLFGVLALGGMLRAMFGRLVGASMTGGITGFASWMLLGSLLGALVVGALAFAFTVAGKTRGRRGRYPYGGYYGGGFETRGGGSGGGGFRGGGGGFGGGGASGRW